MPARSSFPSPRHGACAWLLVVLLLSACASAPARPAVAPVEDPGATARAAVLDRYDGEPDTTSQQMPDLVGLRPDEAAEELAALGLRMQLTPFDRTQPVSVTIPPAGAPTPLDGVVDVWLGVPPLPLAEDVASAANEPEVQPADAMPSSPPDEPTASATAAPPSAPPSEPAVAGTPLVTTHVLPPHTAGLLRINPRRLPALPMGTRLDGLASWYGPGFHGLTTACGGVYDQNGPTIAARELRCGTVVRIVGPTGLTVEATVTDWGPAEWTGRRFDLSAAVFNAIAPLSAGVIPVTVVTANVPG